MLVIFKCNAFHDITMFGDVAERLLKMMGHSGTIPSAILAEDVPAALERLQKAIKAEPPEKPLPRDEEDEEEPAVSLSHRALPLIEMLTAAARDNCNVMWDKR